MGDKIKPDVTLPDGRELSFDMDQVTVAEWRKFFEEVNVDVEDAIIERCSGLEPGELAKLGLGSYRKLTKAFYKRVKRDADPNED